MPAMSIEQIRRRHEQMKQLIDEIFVEGVHYGKVGGTDKDVLLKPGGEEACALFGVAPTYELLDKIEDWTGKEHSGEPMFYYRFRCRLWKGLVKDDRGHVISGLLLGEGEGCCSSWESKYRYRWVAKHDIPAWLEGKDRLKTKGGPRSEPDFAITKGETTGPYGKPAEYWEMYRQAIDAGLAKKVIRKTKAGKPMDAWEIDLTLYRIPNEDVCDQVNTILKISQKRAFLAPVLTTFGLSERFTQDMEDAEEERAATAASGPPTGPPSQQQEHSQGEPGQEAEGSQESQALLEEVKKLAPMADITAFLRYTLCLGPKDDLKNFDAFSKANKLKDVLLTERKRAGDGVLWVKNTAANYRAAQAALAQEAAPAPPPQAAPPPQQQQPPAKPAESPLAALIRRFMALCQKVGGKNQLKLMNGHLSRKFGVHDISKLQDGQLQQRVSEEFDDLERRSASDLRLLLEGGGEPQQQPALVITDDDVPF